jgi:hypothetical protein
MKFTNIDRLFNSCDEILNEYKSDAVFFFNEHIEVPYHEKINLLCSFSDEVRIKDISKFISDFDLLIRVGYYPDLFGFVSDKTGLYTKYIEKLYANKIKIFIGCIKGFDKLVILESEKNNLIIKQILAQSQNIKEVFLCNIRVAETSFSVSKQQIGYVLSQNPDVGCVYIESNNDIATNERENYNYYRLISAICNIIQGICIIPCIIDVINIVDRNLKIEQVLSKYTDIKCSNTSSLRTFLQSVKFNSEIILMLSKLEQFVVKFSNFPFKYKDFISDIALLFDINAKINLDISIQSSQDLRDIILLECMVSKGDKIYSPISNVNKIHDYIIIHITDNFIARYNTGNLDVKKQMRSDVENAINSSKNVIICYDLKDNINAIIARKELSEILSKAKKYEDKYPKKKNYQIKEIDNFDRRINDRLYFKDIKMLMNHQIDFVIFHSCKMKKVRDFFDYDYNIDFGNIVHKLAVNPEVIPTSDDKYFKILVEPKLRKISAFLLDYNKEMRENGFDLLNELGLSNIFCEISISDRKFIIIAKPDRVDTSIHGGILSDYKTSLTTSFADETSFKSPQLLCYSMIIASSEKKYNISEVRYIYLNKNGKCEIKSKELSLIGNAEEFKKSVINSIGDYLSSERIITESDDVNIKHITRIDD